MADRKPKRRAPGPAKAAPKPRKPAAPKPVPPTMPPVILGPATIETVGGTVVFGPVPPGTPAVGATGLDLATNVNRIAGFLALSGLDAARTLLRAVGTEGVASADAMAVMEAAYPSAPAGAIAAVLAACRASGLVAAAAGRLISTAGSAVPDVRVQLAGTDRLGRIPPGGYLHAAVEVARRGPTGAAVPKAAIPEEVRGALAYAAAKGLLERATGAPWPAYRIRRGTA